MTEVAADVIEIPVSEGKGKAPNITPQKESTLTAEELDQKLQAAAAAREHELAKVADKCKVFNTERLSEAEGKRRATKENLLENLQKFQQRTECAAEKAAAAIQQRKEKAADHNRTVAETVAQSKAAEDRAEAAERQAEREREAVEKAAAAIQSKKQLASQHNAKVAEAVALTHAQRAAKAEARQKEVDALSSPFSPKDAVVVPDEAKTDVMVRSIPELCLAPRERR